MATAYRLDSDGGFISASRSNNGSEVRISLSDNEHSGLFMTFDTADFMKFLATLSKNWGK